jgi:dicarboxylate transporter 10
LQTQQQVKFGFLGMSLNIIKTDGFLALYNGISAAVLRQATYSATRFALYESLTDLIKKQSSDKGGKFDMPFYQKIFIAGSSGLIGGIVGTPADLTNVRMQNDTKLPMDQRRNYKHAFEALSRITKTEGVSRLFAGASMASSRGCFVTVGQLAFYDEVKFQLIKSTYFKDNLATHFTGRILFDSLLYQ